MTAMLVRRTDLCWRNAPRPQSWNYANSGPPAVSIRSGEWIVPDVLIQIQRLWIAQIGVWYRCWIGAPVRAEEPSHIGAVVSCSEIVESSLISFFAGRIVRL